VPARSAASSSGSTCRSLPAAERGRLRLPAARHAVRRGSRSPRAHVPDRGATSSATSRSADDDYLAKRDALMAALEQEGPGTSFIRITARGPSLVGVPRRRVEGRRRLGAFSMVFIETDTKPFAPGIAAAPGAQLGDEHAKGAGRHQRLAGEPVQHDAAQPAVGAGVQLRQRRAARHRLHDEAARRAVADHQGHAGARGVQGRRGRDPRRRQHVRPHADDARRAGLATSCGR
jgi:hypothetical protein